MTSPCGIERFQSLCCKRRSQDNAVLLPLCSIHALPLVQWIVPRGAEVRSNWNLSFLLKGLSPSHKMSISWLTDPCMGCILNRSTWISHMNIPRVLFCFLFGWRLQVPDADLGMIFSEKQHLPLWQTAQPIMLATSQAPLAFFTCCCPEDNLSASSILSVPVLS